MAKKKSWFGWVKKLFICSERTKIAKDWRWELGRVEIRQYPALMAPQKTLSEASEEQKRHAINVAKATAAAAEAAVAAAEAAAKVVRLTAASASCKSLGKFDPNFAAIKIQSAYRAHLARKALRALKGVVRLQAIIRGRLVRRQTLPALKRLRSNSRARFSHKDQSYKDGQNKKYFEEKELKFEDISQEEWNCSTFSKEDIESILLKRQEAAIKRERMKKYSFSHRERRNNIFTNKESQPQISQEELETSKPFSRSKSRHVNDETRGKIQGEERRMKHRSDSIEIETSREVPIWRNSFSHDQKWDLFGDDVSISNSTCFPTYMAATESAKAKTRSLSIPKQRVGFWDGCLNVNYPNKHRLSLWSSYDGESFLHN